MWAQCESNEIYSNNETLLCMSVAVFFPRDFVVPYKYCMVPYRTNFEESVPSSAVTTTSFTQFTSEKTNPENDPLELYYVCTILLLCSSNRKAVLYVA
jgi:hypothetical protein